MKEIIKILSNEDIVGFHTIDSDDEDDMYCGKIIKYEDDLLYFLAYDNNGENSTIEVESEDIVWFETNSGDTEYLARTIINKDKFPIKKQVSITENAIREHLHHLWENEIPAVYQTEKEEYEAYLVGYDENNIILHTFNSWYNVDHGFICIPINVVKKLDIYTHDLNAYPILYHDYVKACRLDSNTANIQLNLLSMCMNEHILIGMQNQMDVKENVSLVGYIESIEKDIVRLRKINPEGIDRGLEDLYINDIANFGWGGLYLDMIEYFHVHKLAKKADEEIILIQDNRTKLTSLLLEAKEKGNVISLISDESEDEYWQSTGFVIDVMGNWFHMTMYDDVEDKWFECYHRIENYSKIRRNGIRELFIEAKFLTRVH